MKKIIKKLLRESLASEEYDDSMFSPAEKKKILKAAKDSYESVLERIKKNLKELEPYLDVVENIKASKDFDDDDKKRILKYIEKEMLDNKRKYEDTLALYNRYINDKENVLKSFYKTELVSADGLGYRIMREKQKSDNLKKNLSKEDLIDLFITALEGGSNYWYYIKHIPDDVKYAIEHLGSSGSEAITNYILDGGKIYFYDIEEVDVHDDTDALSVEDDDKGYLGYVDLDTILEAITILKRDYIDSYHNILDDSYDANDADIFLQLCVMGEVVYG
jgi:hypothetical protein